MLSLIVAVAENRVIGRQGTLPWRQGADLKRFQRLTMGRPIVMGRRTWESIARPLPGRTSIVVTRQRDFDPGFPQVLVAHSLDEALMRAQDQAKPDDPSAETFIIGGARLYEAGLAIADRLYWTQVHAIVEGDAFFPNFPEQAWELVATEFHAADERNEYSMTFRTYTRLTSRSDHAAS